MELVNFEGIEITLAKLSLARAQRWESSSATGMWCGVLAEGTIETAASGRKKTCQPKTTVNYCIEEPLSIEHHAPESCQLGAVFIRVPLPSVNSVLSDDIAALLTQPQDEFRSWQDHRAASALAWQMLGCPLTGSARRLGVMPKRRLKAVEKFAGLV